MVLKTRARQNLPEPRLMSWDGFSECQLYMYVRFRPPCTSHSVGGWEISNSMAEELQVVFHGSGQAQR